MASHSAIAPSAQDEKSKSPAQTPKPHQLEAETFCWENRRVILADDMGVGKTLPAIRAATGRIIVICPATVKANWRREILREKPDARVLILSGTVPSTIEPDVDFALLNYDIAEAWQDYLIAWRPETCIGDEAHVTRNRRTARFSASCVLVIEFDFTSAIMLQAEDRVHRLGRTRHVTVEYLYANATVDGFMLALINRKQKIFDQACDGLADPDYLLRLSKERR